MNFEKFDEYQDAAVDTDQTKKRDSSNSEERLLIGLLGLAGEAGHLLTEYKKVKLHIQGIQDTPMKSLIKEELGDILWYIASVAHTEGFTLSEIATNNINKLKNRYNESHPQLYDGHAFHDDEKFPDKLTVDFIEFQQNNKKFVKIILPLHTELPYLQVGDKLTDNNHDEDYYRYHDAFHFTFATILGWSPAIRALLKLKRKSKPEVDENEDGARAIIIEEAVVAMIFSHASKYNFYAGSTRREVDYSLLKLVTQITLSLEVRSKTMKEWEDAIIKGCEVFVELKKNNGGRLILDFENKIVSYQKLPQK